MNDIYIFDLDGTLIDSMPVDVGIVLGFLKENGVPCPEDLVKRLTPLGYKGSAEYIARHTGGKFDANNVYDFFQEKTLLAYGESIPLKANVAETLRALSAHGARLNVLTASPKKLTDLCLKRLGVYEYFENVWSIDDFGMTKAQTEIYEEAAKRLNAAPSDCIMADDNLLVIKTARAVGMRTIGVYDASADADWQEMQSSADFCVRSFEEILR